MSRMICGGKTGEFLKAIVSMIPAEDAAASGGFLIRLRKIAILVQGFGERGGRVGQERMEAAGLRLRSGIWYSAGGMRR